MMLINASVCVCRKASPPIGWYQIILLGDRGTCVLTACPGMHSIAERPGFELATYWSQVQRPNHSATDPHPHPRWEGAMNTSVNWEGNCRSGVALSMRHRHCIHLRAQRAGQAVFSSLGNEMVYTTHFALLCNVVTTWYCDQYNTPVSDSVCLLPSW